MLTCRSVQFFRSSEPLEGLDTLDVLLNMNEPVHIRYPGFRHRFVRLYVIFCVILCSRSTCWHVDPFKRCLNHSKVFFVYWLNLFFLQQLTSERKQMAKAMAAANKSSKTVSSFKRQSAPPASAPPPKRRSFSADRPIVCYNCQQPGHIAPKCPSRPAAASTPAAKSSVKK